MASCADEPVEKESIVPPELMRFYERFYAEAEKRGRKLDRKFVVITIEDSLVSEKTGRPILGTANRKAKTIKINRTLVRALFIGKSAEIQLEYVFFHEMGHYQLKRKHSNELDDNGELVSMMAASSIAYSHRNIEKREYYLDELYE